MQKVKVKRGLSGLGLFADAEFKKEDFVIEYSGEIISEEEANRRGGKYLFEINNEWTIDGRERGNLARYLNHSCQPNAYAETDEQARRVRVFANRTIGPGEEITIDYGKEYVREYLSGGRCRCEACQR